MKGKHFSWKLFIRENTVIFIPAVLKLILNLLFINRYGYFRDELYYIACSDHLAWGYVDQPPLSLAILKIMRRLFGDSLLSVRITAVLAGAAVIIITGLIARKLGGGRFAQGVAAWAVFLSAAFTVMTGTFFSMNAFDILFWALAFYILLLIIKENRPKLWPLFGLIAGLGLMNKYSILFLGIGLVVGLLLTSHRKQLINKWFWTAAAIVFLITLPHILWEIHNHFPSLEFIRNASMYKNARISIVEFFLSQILLTGFGQVLIWIAGICYFFIKKEGEKLIFFGLMYPVIFIILFAGNGKAYYLIPVYTVYLASGGVLLEKIFQKRKLLGTAAVSLILAPMLLLFPYAFPMLKVDTFIRFSQWVGISISTGENNRQAVMPQYYADMFGWEEFTQKVAGIYNKLTPAEKDKCIIYVRNYGEAGAIDFFGKKYGLPKAYCAHNSYWYWADLDKKFDIMIVVGAHSDLEENLAELRRPDRFDSVEPEGQTNCRYCMPYENERWLFLCKGPKFNIKQIWEQEKTFI